VGVVGLEDVLARRLAEALLEFDALLARDVFEHVQARADHWDDLTAGEPVAPGRRELAQRYRLLASEIQARSRFRTEFDDP
jgi:hypothetical protein